MKTTAFILVCWFCIMCKHVAIRYKYTERKTQLKTFYRLKFKMGKNPIKKKHSILNEQCARVYDNDVQKLWYFELLRATDSLCIGLSIRTNIFTKRNKKQLGMNCMCGNRFILIQMHFDLHYTPNNLSLYLSNSLHFQLSAMCWWSRVMWSTVKMLHWCKM